MRTAVISVSVLRLRTTSMHSYIRFPAKGQGRNARTWTVSSIHGQLEVGQFTPSRLGTGQRGFYIRQVQRVLQGWGEIVTCLFGRNIQVGLANNERKHSEGCRLRILE